MNEVRQIISQLEHQKAAIERALSALREIEGPRPGGAQPHSAPAPVRPKKRHLSAEGRRRIAEAARKRWAAIRAKQAAAGKKSKA